MISGLSQLRGSKGKKEKQRGITRQEKKPPEGGFISFCQRSPCKMHEGRGGLQKATSPKDDH